MSSLILDAPLLVTTPAIDPVTLAAINQAWTNNAMQLGYFCLAVGFLIGFGSAYIYFKRNYGIS